MFVHDCACRTIISGHISENIGTKDLSNDEISHGNHDIESSFQILDTPGVLPRDNEQANKILSFHVT